MITGCVLSLDPGPRRPDADSFGDDRCAQCGAHIADDEGRGSTTQGPFTDDDAICGGCMMEFAAGAALPGDDDAAGPDTTAMEFLEMRYNAPVEFDESTAYVRGVYTIDLGDTTISIVHLEDGRWQPHAYDGETVRDPCYGEYEHLVNACEEAEFGVARLNDEGRPDD